MNLILVRPAMPAVDPAVPAHRRRLDADGLAAARRLLEGAVARHAALAAGRTLVIGSHGMAMTVWLAARTGLDPGPFWARLRFPDMIDVDLGAGVARRRTP
jgi:broad specificity phosphatase PhoE